MHWIWLEAGRSRRVQYPVEIRGPRVVLFAPSNFFRINTYSGARKC
jgi:hypothetical protein